VTKFVGREGDLKRLNGLLESGERLITVVGQPGIGKTRLTRELAQIAGPAPFCELAAVRDVEGICRAMATGLGVPLSTLGASVAQIGRVLADRSPPFIVIDNFEHVIGFVRETIGVWRDFTPEIAMVVTSRQRLLLPGELVHELGKLGQEALELLIDGVERAGRTVTGDSAELAALAAIADRLQGVPLAIELVAPRIALLGARTVQKRLSERLDVLSLSPVRAALDWSWALLTEPEQKALARSATFAGSFNAQAAEHLIGDSALELLQGLRQKSLLVVSPPPAERFEFAFSVREFALEKLAAEGALDESHRAHAHYFADWAKNIEETAHPSEVLEELGVERQNLVDAAERSLKAGDAEPALRLAIALHTLSCSRGPFHGYEELLSRAIELGGKQDPPAPSLAWALSSRAHARRRVGAFDRARADFERAIASARTAGDAEVEGRTRSRLGLLLISTRQLADAHRELDEALRMHQRNRDRPWEAHTLYALGLLRNEQGQPERASEAFERALRIFEDVGTVEMLGTVRLHLADAHLHRGRIDDAARESQAALEAHRQTGNVWLEAVDICNHGSVALSAGRFEEAVTHYDLGLALLKPIGDDRSMGTFLGLRAMAVAALGRLEVARADLAHGVDLVRGSGDDRCLGSVLGWLAGVQAELGNVEAAEASLAEGLSVIRGLDIKSTELVLAAEALIVDVARARALSASGDEDGARALVQRIGDRFEAMTRQEDGSPEYVWYYVRCSFDRVRRALAALDDDRGPDEPPFSRRSVPPAASLVVDAHGRWLVSPRGGRHSIARKITLQRILVCLAEARLKRPGEAVSHDELFSRGWPEERMVHNAAVNRLRVALARLRQLGLDDWLIGLRGGYLLDPDLPLTIETVDPRDDLGSSDS
jgi:predicted ATPase